MPFEESPSLEDYQNGLPDHDDRPVNKKRETWRMIAALFVVIVILSGVRFFQSDQGALLRGKSTVTGVTTDIFDQPVAAQVFVSGTDIGSDAGADGKFELNNIPAGNQTIVLAFNYIGVEIDVKLVAGSTLDLGQVKIPDNTKLIQR